jgi:hypothetical protein
MKWGIRRYQNKDGSLTPAGRKRYAAEAAKLRAREKELKGREKTAAKVAKLDAKKAELDEREKALTNPKPKAPPKPTTPDAPKQKSVKDMTDDELRTAVNRLRLEQDYRNLNPQKVSAGKRFVRTVANQVLVPALVDVGKKAAKAMLEDALSKATGLEIKDGNKGKKKDDDKKDDKKKGDG